MCFKLHIIHTSSQLLHIYDIYHLYSIYIFYGDKEVEPDKCHQSRNKLPQILYSAANVSKSETNWDDFQWKWFACNFRSSYNTMTYKRHFAGGKHHLYIYISVNECMYTFTFYYTAYTPNVISHRGYDTS